MLSDPVFHLSEGQRQHAEALNARFRLYVVYGIERTAARQRVERCDGWQLVERAHLRPASWTGVLTPSS